MSRWPQMLASDGDAHVRAAGIAMIVSSRSQLRNIALFQAVRVLRTLDGKSVRPIAPAVFCLRGIVLSAVEGARSHHQPGPPREGVARIPFGRSTM